MTDANIQDLFGDMEDIPLDMGENADASQGGGPKETYKQIEDAFIDSLNNSYGKVDIYYIAEKSGHSADEVISELEGRVILQDPKAYDEHKNPYEDWYTVNQYLKGNLDKLLKTAEEMNEKYNRFMPNIEKIRSIYPRLPELEEIHVSLGAAWIPAYYVSEFIRRLLDLPMNPKVRFNKFLHEWFVETYINPDNILNEHTYGTERKDALSIIKATLNAQSIEVRDRVSDNSPSGYKYVVNPRETVLAEEKQQKILKAFKDYVFSDDEAYARLREVYVQEFCYPLTSYDGAFLKLNDLSKDVILYKHQKDAVARILLSKATYIAHDIGSGKTYEIIVGAHELHRTGQAHRVLVVVPNNVFSATVKMHRQLYPNDKILIVSPNSFTPDERGKVLEQMTYGGYVACYMAYSSFDMLRMTKGYYEDEINEEMANVRQLIKQSGGNLKDKYETVEKKLKKRRVKLEEEYENEEDNICCCFDKLGIDALFLDEAHNYKNIPIECSLNNIIGLNNRGFKKCKYMLDKVRFIQKNGGNVAFFSGTPLTNSLADLYVIQTYLQHEELEALNISKFGEWVNTFCERELLFEVDVDTNNSRFMTRFSKFHNLSELMNIFSGVCSFYSPDKKDYDLPEFKGYTDIVCPKTAFHKEYYDYISLRVEDIRHRAVRRTVDNLLKVTVDGRKAGLDMRLIKFSEEDFEEGENEYQDVRREAPTKAREISDSLDDYIAKISSGESGPTKVSKCVDTAFEIYSENPDKTQLIFSDMGTPKTAFNIYDELKRGLISRGVNARDIAFIHDGTTEVRKLKMIRDFNDGKIRILIGSTFKLGIGVNVQERLYAIHHLDVPWRPADVAQREGRIIRQGNENSQVRIFRYVTESSFDAYIWQLLEKKQIFISSFLSGSLSLTHRSEEDLNFAVLNYAEIKALAIGNPLLKERVEVKNMYDRLRINEVSRNKELMDLSKRKENLPTEIKNAHFKVAVLNHDMKLYCDSKEVVSNDERQSLGSELMEELKKNVMQEKDRLFDWYQGFMIILPANMTHDKPYVRLEVSQGGKYAVDMKDIKGPMAVSKRLDATLRRLSEIKDRMEEKIAALEKECINVDEELTKGNPFTDKATVAFERLQELDRELRFKEDEDNVEH